MRVSRPALTSLGPFDTLGRTGGHQDARGSPIDVRTSRPEKGSPCTVPHANGPTRSRTGPPRFRRVFALLVLTAAILPSAPAQTPPRLEICPASIRLGAGEEAAVLIVLRNETGAPLTGLRLSPLASPSARVTIDPVPADSLAPGGGLTWKAGLVGAEPGSVEGPVYFQLDGQYLPDVTGGRPVPFVALAALALQERDSDSVDDVAELRVESGFEELRERRAGELLVTVRNKTAVSVSIVGLEAGTPDFLVPQKTDLPGSFDLSPGETRAFPVRISAGDAVQTGQHLLHFQARVNWSRGGLPRSGSLFTTHKIKVGIPGESEILTLLGVPSFFLLPGFLALSVFVAFWNRVRPKTRLGIDAKSVEFWLLAITLSLGATLLYPLLTGLFGRPRDYLDSYGLRDIYSIWIGSLGAGLFFWLIAVAGLRARQGALESRRQRLVPAENDSPLEILLKLGRHGLGICRPLVDVPVPGGGTQRLFLLVPPPKGRSDFWAAPAMIVEWTDRADDGDKGEFARHLEKGEALALSEFLRRLSATDESEPRLTVRWKNGGQPLQASLETAPLNRDFPPGRIVEEG